MKYRGSKEEIEKLQAEVDAKLGYDRVTYVDVGGGVHRPHELQKTTHFEPVYDDTVKAYVYDVTKLDTKIASDAVTKFAVTELSATVEVKEDEAVVEMVGDAKAVGK